MKFEYYSCDVTTGEVNRCHKAKVVADIASHFRISNVIALFRLNKTDINNCIKIGNYEFWVE